MCLQLSKLRENRMFARMNDRAGVIVVLIDDCAQGAAEDPRTADEIFVAGIATALAEKGFVKGVVLADFDFQPDWMKDVGSNPEDCIYLVDVFSGEGTSREARGVIVRNALLGITCKQKIALFTKALDSELGDLFGDEHGHEIVPKAIGLGGRAAGAASIMVGAIASMAVAFVEKCLQDPYLKAVASWNETERMLEHWPPRRQRLFPHSGQEHDAQWWVENFDPNNLDHRGALDTGRTRLAELSGADLERFSLSHKAVFCGLKALERGRGSARLFCEIAGIKADYLDEWGLVLQLLKFAGVGVDAQSFRAMYQLRTTSPGSEWCFKIEQITEEQLILSGFTELSANERASSAARTLSMSPRQRMNDERYRNAPGNGVIVADKLRAHEWEVRFFASDNILNVKVVIPLEGSFEISQQG